MAQPRRSRSLITAGVFVVIAAVLVVLLLATDSSPPRKASSFSLPRLGGGPNVSYPAGGPTGGGPAGGGVAGGGPTVIVLFASWCTPCQAELPVVARTERKLAASHSPVRFIGIDGNDAAADGLSFARKSGVEFPVASDENELVASRYGFVGLPDTIFIAKGGVVAHVVQGAVTKAILDQWVARIA